MSWPAIATVPEVGRSRPAARCSNVVLPEPDGPTMAASSPGSTWSVTPRTDSTGGAPG